MGNALFYFFIFFLDKGGKRLLDNEALKGGTTFQGFLFGFYNLLEEDETWKQKL